MATTTPFYQWSVPTSSDLVKNGATAIETLGDSVDDSLWNVGFGQAGKNKIINGDFFWNQRNFTSVTTNAYGFDRFRLSIAGAGTATYTPQTFTAGTSPVAGYEAKNFARVVSASQSAASDRVQFIQNIEGVRNFAGQTATVSFWAKAGSGTPSITAELVQSFGTSGSASVTGILDSTPKRAITTAWVRYTYTFAVPSISGKTVGTDSDSLLLVIWLSGGSDFNARTGTLGNQNNTFDIWGVQIEYGSKATPFQTATGTIQGELAACQRYYWRSTNSSFVYFGTGFWNSSTLAYIIVNNPVAMRSNPTSIDSSGTGVFDGAGTAVTSLALTQGGTIANLIAATTAGSGVQYRPVILRADPSNNYLGFSAEL
jgi:hypothetical protein